MPIFSVALVIFVVNVDVIDGNDSNDDEGNTFESVVFVADN